MPKIKYIKPEYTLKNNEGFNTSNYISYVNNNYKDYLDNLENKIIQEESLSDSWTKTIHDDYNYFNTLTFRNRFNRYTKKYDVPPSMDLINQSIQFMNGYYKKKINKLDKVFTVLEKGSDTGRLHLHQLIKLHEQKEKNHNWIWSFNNHWYNHRGNFGAYKLVEINNKLNQVDCCSYVTKASAYIHKDQTKDYDGASFFPHFWIHTKETVNGEPYEEKLTRFKRNFKLRKNLNQLRLKI